MRLGRRAADGLGMVAAIALCTLALGGADARADRLPNPRQIAIAGIKFGMTPAKVRSILGQPHSTRKWHAGSREVVEVEWHYQDRLTVAFFLRDGRLHGVNRVRTYSPRDRLPNGLHVNSSWTTLRRKLPSSVCGQYSGGPEVPWPSGYICTWFPPSGNRDLCAPNLTFYMRHRGARVKYIELAGNVGKGC